jgi:4-hydroxybutyrate dehydrogenase
MVWPGESLTLMVEVQANNDIPIAVMSFPTRMIVGPGSLSRVPDEVFGLKATRVLIVADKGVEAAGLAERLRAVLIGADIHNETYLGVSKNPTEKDVLEGVEAFRATGADIVIGIGGGAPLDVAKAIRLKVTHDRPLEDYDDLKNGWQLIGPNVPPMIAIPTTAGTGSEVGRSSVVCLGADMHKVIVFSPHLMANVAICDAELTLGLPPHVTAATGMDALTHCIEAYVAKGAHPFADMFALAGLARCGAHLVTAVQEGSNLRARHEMMLAASMGAVSFQKGLGACHALAHPLSAIADMHHGLANSIMLPHVIGYNLEHAAEKYAVAAEALGVKPNGKTVDQRARACLDRIKSIIRDIKLPTKLSDAGAKPEMIERMVPQALADASHPSNPRELTADAARRLYESAM